MLEDLQIRRYSPTTVRLYLRAVAEFAQHFGQPPDQLGADAALEVALTPGQIMSHKMQDELLRIEKEFSHAIVTNDAEAVGRFLADDWIIVDPDGGVIDKTRFLDVIKSGALIHEAMASDDIRVRVYGNTAIVTALTTTKGKFSG